ncbi:MAG: 5-methyltetrahydropteroyltriglutamate--homocysteine S-methyltransferase [Hyphomicrobiales bacterium]|nr:5-methyltetrahydropteroyltriglutamate--homocysteine S-methyltransferase [Hyphomicrobiales bacterium]MBV8827138.1 5-methyltetrahydropteroyltriglutamate--homocysteine S-methyltransferase [Hyphomicrobiales bacterium]MBV9426739.1 5-methyltetrahydropteroyltriglutamate--homocysteine S-methyltransferase [Bradyrhizobiaceae bacterium]
MIQRGAGRPPFRADHVGSLLRPAALRQAFRQHGTGNFDDDAYRAMQDRCIRDAVAMQEAVGLKVVTDGEFRRGSYWGRFVERMHGFVIKPALFKFRDDAGHEVAFTAPYAVDKIRRAQPLALDEFVFLREATGVTAKITLPAPSTMHFYRCSDFATREAYQDVDAFFADLATAFRAEIAALAEAGCRYVQLDEVAVALLCDPLIRQQVEAAGSAPDRLVDLYIGAINQAVAGRPADMVVGVHMCRGNFKGHYLAAGGYGSVAERFFANTEVDHFLLEYDTPRAGDFAPLRFVPKEKGVVLGLVSTKTPVLETLDALKRRVDEAARAIDVDRLAISPQCGFASTVAGNALGEPDQRSKLSLVVCAAAEIWKD